MVSLLGGLLVGAALTRLAPAAYVGLEPSIPLWLIAPFAVLLLSIAVMPFISGPLWHRHYPDFAMALGGVVAGYYLAGLNRGGNAYGSHQLAHALMEYYSFIALVGGLFVVSGGILVDLRGRGTPLTNTILLACGAVLANIVGTTGASMLLIRPYMRINHGRLHPLHVVFFLFIVSNCGGCLTPIGDPPLYLGYLHGVPFLWTLKHLWEDWVLTVGLLLGAFVAFEVFFLRRRPDDRPAHPAPGGLSIRGAAGIVGLCLIVAGVFIDPLLTKLAGIDKVPVGATFQIAVTLAAFRLAPRQILAANEFNFGPVKEVGLLFLGIFVAMTPTLAILSQHGDRLGVQSPTAYYFATGVLSAFLDNAPTYLSFMKLAFGPTETTDATVAEFLQSHVGTLIVNGISTGAVFFGAMTYIGNGPNFMIKAIAEGAGVKMPSFFGYLGWASLILLPVLVLHWLVLIW